MLRNSVLSIGFAVTALLAFQVGGCSSGGGGSNGGSGGTGTAGSTGTAGNSATGTGGNSATGAGGTTGTGGSATGTGGSGTGGSGTGGSATGTGGSGTGGSGTGGSGTGGSGTGGTGTGGSGTGGSGTGGTGTGGATGTGGTGGANPNCPTSITDKTTTCTMEGLVCGKPCGIESKGTKNCTCTSGVFMCETVAPTCHYPDGSDLTCYHLPSPVPACPTGTTSNAACTADACMPCSGYQDSSMTAKTGYCVCVAMKWKCASDKEWPPQ
jgi:hypothetical protein